MIVYLVRHAEAKEVGSPGVASDEERPLTSEGKEVVSKVGRALRALGCRPGLIVTSPLLRAEQTGEILRGLLPTMPPLEKSESLLVDSPPSDVLDMLSRIEHPEVLLVGHEPLLGKIASIMISNSASANIRFRKGGSCCIVFAARVEGGAGELSWHLPPDIATHLLAE